MQSDKPQQLEEAYRHFLEMALYDRPLEAVEEYLDRHIMGYGTTPDEKIESVAGFIAMVQRQRFQASGIEIEIKEAPVYRKMLDQDTTAIFVDEFELVMDVAPEPHRLFLRLSSVLNYREGNWRVIHFHCSLPGNTDGSEDAWHIREWQRQKEELEQKVAGKTAELEKQNRVLQIEAALERVRAASLAMQHTSELHQVVHTVSQQFQELELDISGGVFISLNEEIDREIVVFGAGNTASYDEKVHVPFLDRPIYTNLVRAIKKDPGFLSESYTNAEKLEFFRHMFQYPPYSATSEAHQREVLARKGGYTRSVTVNRHTTLFMINHHGRPFSGADNDILIRFGKVFEQSYTRFLDLKKAEAQAREAQVEAALERVRSATMAMHQSDELRSVIAVMLEQVKTLGIDAEGGCLVLYDTESGDNTIWLSGFGPNIYPESYFCPYFDHPYLNAQREAWKSGVPFERFVWEGELKKTVDDYYFQHTDYQHLPAETRDELRNIERAFLSDAFMSHGFLEVASTAPLSADQEDALQRFAKVFDQTYTRFLDLKKAEAQAREAKIETALERVRASSMAMHHSSELSEVASVVFKQLESLELDVHQSWIDIVSVEKGRVETWKTDFGGQFDPHPISVPLTEPGTAKLFEEWKTGVPFIELNLRGEEVRKWIEFFHTATGDSIFEWEEYPESLYNLWATNKFGSVSVATLKPPEPETKAVLSRFSKVFEQSYTRFLDLKKAEAQAREAQIEAALERVRARTMAMHQSYELQEVVAVLYQQIEGLNMANWGSNILIFNEAEQYFESWIGATYEGAFPESYIISGEHPVIERMWEIWHRKMTDAYLSLSGDAKASYDDFVFENTDFKKFPPAVKKDIRALKEVHFSVANMKYGSVVAINTDRPLDKENFAIVRRFAKVFEQAYTRFLDLERAQKQAREARIEAALERVRARTMAMHKSEELSAAADVLFDQVAQIGITATSSWITLVDAEQDTMVIRPTVGVQRAKPVKVSGEDHPNFRAEIEAWKSESPYIEIAMPKTEFIRAVKATFGQRIEDRTDKTYFHVLNVRHRYGFLGLSTWDPIGEEERAVYSRFGSVFEQTYTRFLDLQKAEAQAREARIEAALERVRSKALAMHRSEELHEVNREIFLQLHQLGLRADAVNLFENIDRNGDWKFWTANEVWVHPEPVFFPFKDISVMRDILEAKEAQLELHEKHYNKRQKNALFKHLHHFFSIPDERFRHILAAPGQSCITAFSEKSALQLNFYRKRQFSPEEQDILRRFAGAFEQAYIRFLDLQKAEAYAREAEIEAALERVRAKTMAMHTSQDVAATVTTFFEELIQLGLPPSIRCGIGIMSQSESNILWTASADASASVRLNEGLLDMTLHPLLSGIKASWQKKEQLFTYELSGADLIRYFKAINEAPDYPVHIDLQALPPKLYHYSFLFPDGNLFAFTEDPLAEEIQAIFKRFAAVFGQTYKRYLDLQKAEAQALEALKQASLDRVHGQIASMRSTEDLNRITPLIWNELTTLGVPFIRCGVFIIDEVTNSVQVFLSDPHGRSLAVLQIGVDDNPLTSNAVKYWRAGEVYQNRWSREDFINWAESMVRQGQIPSAKSYQGAAEPPESLHLHFVPFTQGMLYVGNVNPLTSEAVELVRSLAEAFAVAYARYEDFTQLEQAKESVESALSELQATQKQLIQSEKMASLGELTAGIAHEIQNPLNFVNNFAQVSNELLEEMKEEVEGGDVEEVKEIIDLLSQNLSKIHHHGGRASSIVKGMLDHSRARSDHREFTDLNSLCDEYLRLSYHGLRARDKSFNASFESDFDPDLPRVEVVSQDIGRVILNLINNAFYVVNEKAKVVNNGYVPKVVVRTRRRDKQIELRVEDNGTGIPEDQIDKIFQPFFTTKPTGQGTGLGLSLSYDIVRAHSGELKVESTRGKGTAMILSLPLPKKPQS